MYMSIIYSRKTDGKIQKTGIKRKSPLDEDEESNDSFKLLSDGEDAAGHSDKVSFFFCYV